MVRNHIAPLQPNTLACFHTWGSSQGAGRMTLTKMRKYDSWVNLAKKACYLLLIIILEEGLFLFFRQNIAQTSAFRWPTRYFLWRDDTCR